MAVTRSSEIGEKRGIPVDRLQTEGYGQHELKDRQIQRERERERERESGSDPTDIQKKERQADRESLSAVSSVPHSIHQKCRWRYLKYHIKYHINKDKILTTLIQKQNHL